MMINDTELLKEIINKEIDQRDTKLKEEMYHKMMESLIAAQRPQQRATGDEVMFWRQVSNILAEEAPDAPKRLVAFISQWAKDKGVPNGNEIYQHGYNIYTRH